MTIEPNKLDFECTSDEFRVAVTGCGLKVEIGADGKVTVFSNPLPVQPQATLKTAASVEALKVGAAMLDGSIYAGISPDTGKPIYATPKDAPLTCAFKEAGKYAANLDTHGRRDWRVPTRAELKVLFHNRAAIGGFDTSGSNTAGWYWSSSRINYNAWTRCFSDGYQDDGSYEDHISALRCVRG